MRFNKHRKTMRTHKYLWHQKQAAHPLDSFLFLLLRTISDVIVFDKCCPSRKLALAVPIQVSDHWSLFYSIETVSWIWFCSHRLNGAAIIWAALCEESFAQAVWTLWCPACALFGSKVNSNWMSPTEATMT